MFKLDSVFLFALDVVKGPYVHCSAPQGNGIAADVLAVATPLHPGTPAVWDTTQITSSVATSEVPVPAPATSAVVTPPSAAPAAAPAAPAAPAAAPAHTSLASTTRSTYPEIRATSSSHGPRGQRPIPALIAPTTTGAGPAKDQRDAETGDVSAENRFAGLSDVFIPRSEFSRRVLWLYPAETRLLYLYYPEEIPGDHYPRKTLRYSLCMAFRVDARMVTVGKQLLNQLVQPYSTVLINVAEELRNAEVRYGYVSRGLEKSIDGCAARAASTMTTTTTMTAPSPPRHPQTGPSQSTSHAESVLGTDGNDGDDRKATSASLDEIGALGLASDKEPIPRVGTFPAVLPSEVNTPTMAASITPMSAASPLSNATFSSATRATGGTVKGPLSASLPTPATDGGVPQPPPPPAKTAHWRAASPSNQATSTTTAGQSLVSPPLAAAPSALASASSASLPTPRTATSVSTASSMEARCLNCFVTPNLAQRWLTLQEFFDAWYASMAPEKAAATRGPATRSARSDRGPSSPARLTGGGGSASALGGPRDEDVVGARLTPTPISSPTITTDKSAWQPQMTSVPATTTTTTTALTSALAALAASPLHTPTGVPHGSPAHAVPGVLPRLASSASGLHSVFRGSVDTMASAGADMESTVYSPLVAHPREKHVSSWDRLARAAVAAAATAGASATGNAHQALPMTAESVRSHDWSTRRIIDALPTLQARWQLVQQLVATTSSRADSGRASARAAPASSASASPMTRAGSPTSAATAASLNHNPTILHLSDGIRFHVRRMAPPAPIKEVPLGYIPVLISSLDQPRMDKMDMAVQRVLMRVDGERSVADIVFQLTFGTSSTLYEVCHAAATQSPQLFGALADPGGLAGAAAGASATSAAAAHAHAAASLIGADGLLRRPAVVIPGSEMPATVASPASPAMGLESTSHTVYHGSSEHTPPSTAAGGWYGHGTTPVSTGGSGVSLDTTLEAQSSRTGPGGAGGLATKSPLSSSTAAPLCVSSMLVQLRKLPQPSALFTRWAPTPIARVSVWHTSPRTLLEATHARRGGLGARTGAAEGEESHPLHDPASEPSALFRAILPVRSPWLRSNGLTATTTVPGSVASAVHGSSPMLSAAGAAAARTGRRVPVSPLQLATAAGPARLATQPPSTGPSSVPHTPGSGTFAALPRAATAASHAMTGVVDDGSTPPSSRSPTMRHADGQEAGGAPMVSALSLPTVDVLRVSIDLPSVWQTYLGIVTEALLQLERCGIVRLLQPWAPHTAYRTTSLFQAVLADRQHPAREAIGEYMLRCAARSRRERMHRRGPHHHHHHRHGSSSQDMLTREPGDSLLDHGRGAGSHASHAKPADPARPSTTEGGDGGEVANARATHVTGSGAHNPLTPSGGAMPAVSANTSSTTHTAATIAVGSLRRVAHRQHSSEADFEDSLRSGYNSSAASLLSHALSYDTAGGTLRLSLARSVGPSSLGTGGLGGGGGGGGTTTTMTAVTTAGGSGYGATSYPSSPTMVVSGSVHSHITGFFDDDASSTSTSARLGPLAHTLLPPAEPLFLSRSVPGAAAASFASGGRSMPGFGSVHGLPPSKELCAPRRYSDPSSGFLLRDLGDGFGHSGALSLPRSGSSLGTSSTSSVFSDEASSSSSASSEDDEAEEGRTDAARRSSPTTSTSRDNASPLTLHRRSSLDDFLLDDFTEAEIRAAASAALCAMSKFTNATIHRVQQEMRWMPTWSMALDAWSPLCCRALVELALLNDWVEVVR